MVYESGEPRAPSFFQIFSKHFLGRLFRYQGVTDQKTWKARFFTNSNCAIARSPDEREAFVRAPLAMTVHNATEKPECPGIVSHK
jgi:hypothetical protein